MIFIDTNAFVALVLPHDTFHHAATDWWEKQDNTFFITTNLIVLETLGWIRYRKGKDFSIKVGTQMFFASDMKIERVLPDDELEAWKLFQKTDGRGISMIDCMSFALMKRLGLTKVFTFDTDFAAQGYIMYPV